MSQNLYIRNRGYNFLIPIGRTLTQQEEKNDADEDSEDSESGQSGNAASVLDDGENESNADLDASMEDLASMSSNDRWSALLRLSEPFTALVSAF